MIKKVICICCFIISLTLFSQEKVSTTIAPDMSVSIYTTLMNKQQITAYKKPFIPVLNLKDFKFMIVDQESIRNGFFGFDVRNIGIRGTNFSSLVFKDFDLYKHFPVVPDLTVLHRFNNNEAIETN